MLQTFYESLTTPDKEDHTILIYNGAVHTVAMREFPVGGEKRETVGRLYAVPLEDFEQLFEGLTPTNHNLGHVQVIIPTDAGEETWRALRLLGRAAKRASFSLTSMVGQVPAKEVFATMQSGLTGITWRPMQ
jgi:hypothetical protein